MKNFSPDLAKQWMPDIRLLATDMDGTMTQNGKFDSRLLQRLEQLESAQIPVFIVTGRSAGWVSALVEYLPISGAIAENGGYFFTREQLSGQPLIDIDARFRQSLEHAFSQLKHQFPQIAPSADNTFRLTDWTFDRNDLTFEQLTQMSQRCQSLGWDFTYSSIQCHIKSPQQSKQAGLLKSIALHWDAPLAPTNILTLGDSPNDAELLDSQVFPYSIGVENISPYLSTMPSVPHWVSSKPELSGFLEVTDTLLQAQEASP